MRKIFGPAESNAYFRQLADGLPQLVWACARDGHCDFLNQQWLDYTGITIEQQLGAAWLQQFHPDDLASFTLALQNLPLAGDSLQIACRIRANDGSYRWFDTRARPVTDATGKLTGWFGSSAEIDKQRAVAYVSQGIAGHVQQAQLDRAYLAAIVENSNDAVISTTIAGRITSWNKAAEQIFGYAAEEAIDQPITMLFPVERMMEEAGILACINAGQEVRHYETQRLHKS